MSTILCKEFECFNCKQAILLSKIDNPPEGSKKKWNSWELDSITPHQCNSKKQESEQDENQQPVPSKPTVKLVDASEQLEVLTQEIKNLSKQVEALNSQIVKLQASPATTSPAKAANGYGVKSKK